MMEALLPYYLERKSKEEASAHEELTIPTLSLINTGPQINI